MGNTLSSVRGAAFRACLNLLLVAFCATCGPQLLPAQGQKIEKSGKFLKNARIFNNEFVVDATPPAATAPTPAVRAADVPVSSPTAAVLHLNNLGFADGELRPSSDPGILRWQVPLFASPFDFTLDSVNAIYFPTAPQLAKATGEYCFELTGGDVLFGSLLALSASEAEIDAGVLGKLHVNRARLTRFSRWNGGAGLVYLGPNGLADWKPTPSANVWRNDQGHLATGESGACIQSNFVLPSRAAIEFEVSWSGKPNFSLVFGNEDAHSLAHAFRIEAWDHDLVLVRETEKNADLASLQPLEGDRNRAHLLVFLDEVAGRCLVYSRQGNRLADLTVPSAKPTGASHLRLTNKRGSLTFERVRVDRWDGVPPANLGGEKSRLHLANGTTRNAELVGFDSRTKEFLIRDQKTSRIPADELTSAFLTGLSPAESPAANAEERSGTLLVSCRDSSRISGRLLKVDRKSLWLTALGIREPLSLPIAGLRSLVVGSGSAVSSELPEGPLFHSENVRLPGKLLEAQKTPTTSCLDWRPEGSRTSSRFQNTADGRIVFRERWPQRPAAHLDSSITSALEVRVNGIQVLPPQTVRRRRQQQFSEPLKQKALYLRTGDAIPCEVKRIDQNGVTISTPVADTKLIPHDKIKAVELSLDGRGPVALTRSKRDRLLTVPRMQKDNPPTHLIRSRDGDYLRGRIVEMDDRKLLVEVRLEVKELPRERVSRIIWLHPEDRLDSSSTTKKPASKPPVLLVQAVRQDGTRLTFQPERFAGTTLFGTSDVLGSCHASFDAADPHFADELYVGAAIEQAATRAAYQQWKMQLAIEPKFVQDENKKGGESGLESALVGKPAPDFELEMLDGAKFHLAERKGRIVVVDFWATWCIGCMQLMPHLDQAHRDFAGRGVEFVAVNLEEAPEKISPLLERHKWRFPVALDRDASVATKYHVTAIPQTIIVNREGNVVRHFVGGDERRAKELAECLQGLLSEHPAK